MNSRKYRLLVGTVIVFTGLVTEVQAQNLAPSIVGNQVVSQDIFQQPAFYYGTGNVAGNVVGQTNYAPDLNVQAVPVPNYAAPTFVQQSQMQQTLVPASFGQAIPAQAILAQANPTQIGSENFSNAQMYYVRLIESQAAPQQPIAAQPEPAPKITTTQRIYNQPELGKRIYAQPKPPVEQPRAVQQQVTQPPLIASSAPLSNAESQYYVTYAQQVVPTVEDRTVKVVVNKTVNVPQYYRANTYTQTYRGPMVPVETLPTSVEVPTNLHSLFGN